jgi:hypothetical protein
MKKRLLILHFLVFVCLFWLLSFIGLSDLSWLVSLVHSRRLGAAGRWLEVAVVAEDLLSTKYGGSAWTVEGGESHSIAEVHGVGLHQFLPLLFPLGLELGLTFSFVLDEILELLRVKLKSGKERVLFVLVLAFFDLFFILGLLELVPSKVSLLSGNSLLLLLLLNVEGLRFPSTLLLNLLS